MNKAFMSEVKNVIYEPCYQKASIYDEDGEFERQGIFKFHDGISARVIHQDKYTIVILSDGSKGVAQCMEGDTYSGKKGLRIAYNRAMIAHLEKATKELCHE